MLLKMKKSAFALAIIGIIFAILLYAVIIIDKNWIPLEFLRKIEYLDFFHKLSSLNTTALLFTFVMGIIFIVKPNKTTTILSLIASIATFNVFLFIASTLVLVELARVEKEIEEQKKQEEKEDDIKVNEVVDDKPIITYKKATHVEFTQKEQNEIAWGIVLASIYIVAFGTLLYFLYSALIPFYYELDFGAWMDSLGPGAMAAPLFFIFWLVFVFVYTLFLLSLMAPIIISMLNIIYSAIALKEKTIKSARKMKKYGNIGLTFVNSHAAKCAINRAIQP